MASVDQKETANNRHFEGTITVALAAAHNHVYRTHILLMRAAVSRRNQVFDSPRGFIHPPGLADGLRKTHPALLEFRHEALKPAQYRRVGEFNPALGHQLDQIRVTQLVAHAPSNVEDNDLAVKVPVLEMGCRGGLKTS